MGRPRLTPDMRVLARRGIVAFELAVLVAGGQNRLAEMIGATDQKISHWKLRDLAIPIDWVPHIVAALRHPMITPYTLRPDLGPYWDLLSPQLAACAKGKARTTMLTQDDFDTIAAIYPMPSHFARVTNAEDDRVPA